MTAIGRAQVIRAQVVTPVAAHDGGRARIAPYVQRVDELLYPPSSAPLAPPAALRLPPDRAGVWRAAAVQHHRHAPSPDGRHCRDAACQAISPHAGYPCPGLLSADGVLRTLYRMARRRRS